MRVAVLMLALLGLADGTIGNSPASAGELVIATGNEGGLYYPTGKAIAAIFEGQGNPVRVVATEGSIANLDLLNKQKVDLAVVQSDILYLARNATQGDALYRFHDLLSNLYGIAALFPEYTQIIVRDDSGIYNIHQLIERDIYLGGAQSGTRKNAEALLTAAGLSETGANRYRIVLADADNESAIAALQSGEIDAVFTTSGELLIDKMAPGSTPLRMLSIDKRLRRMVKEKHSEYGFTETTDRFGRNYLLMFTRAVLVIRTQGKFSTIDDATVRLFTEHLLDEFPLQMARFAKNRNVTAFSGEMYARGIPVSLHPEVDRVFLAHGVQISFWDVALSGIVLLSLTLLGLWFRFGDNRAIVIHARTWLQGHTSEITQERLGRWAKYAEHPIMLGVIALLGSLILVVSLILWLEDDFARSNDTPNFFAEQNFGELLIWLLTFAATGYTQNLYPDSGPGKVLAALIPIAGLGSIIATLLWSLFQRHRRQERLARGELVPAGLRDHVIVCGWNARAPGIIRAIISTRCGHPVRKVVVIADLSRESPLAQYDFRPGFVFYCRGISSSHDTLAKALVNTAASALVLADDGKVQRSNYRSVLTVFALRRFRSDSADFPVISELHFESNRARFVEAGVSKLIPLREYGERLMTHALLNPGVIDLIKDLLDVGGQHTVELTEIERCGIADKLIDKPLAVAAKLMENNSKRLISVYRAPSGHAVRESELEFQAASPYHFAIEQEEQVVGEVLRIAPGDALMSISQQGGACIDSSITRRLREFSGTAVFACRREHILIVGRVATCTSMLKAVAAQSASVTLLTPDTQDDEMITRLPTNVTAITSTDPSALQKIVATHQDRFTDITRAVILASAFDNDNDNDNDNEQGTPYQDDITMVWAIQLRHALSKLGKSALHLVAEVRNEDNLHLFHDIGVAQPIPVNRMLELVATRMVYHHGLVSEFFMKLLSYSETNKKARLVKLSLVDLGDVSVFTKMSFEQLEAALLARRPALQLIAILHATGGLQIFPHPITDELGGCVMADDFLFVIRRP